MVTGTFSIPLDHHIAFTGDTNGDQPSTIFPLRSYVAGPENYLLQVVADSFFVTSTSFHPLLIHGPAGTGKSALIRGLLSRWQQFHPGSHVTLTTGQDFVRHLSEDGTKNYSWSKCLIAEKTPAWFVIDNLEELLGQSRAQNKLCGVLDELDRLGSRFIAISRSCLDKLQLCGALSSRLAAGLTVPVRLPSPLTRTALVSHLADTYNLQLGPGVALMFTSSSSLTFSQLQHALLQVEILAAPSRSIGPEHVTQYFSKRHFSKQPPGDQLVQIARFVATHCQVNVRQMCSSSRMRNLVFARRLFIYLARRYRHVPLTEIGRFLGGRDHSTISHSLRNIDLAMAADSNLQHTVDEITSQLLVILNE